MTSAMGIFSTGETGCPQPDSSPRGGVFIDLDEASRRSGWSVGHIKRMCGSAKYAPGGITFESKGLARQETPSEGGKPTWMVSEAADARFARVKFAEQISAEQSRDKARLPAQQREQIDLRLRLVRLWEEKLAAGVVLKIPAKKVTASFCDQLLITDNIKVSPASLYNWKAAYRRGGELGLLDGRSARSQVSGSNGHTATIDIKTGELVSENVPASDPFLQFVQKMFLTPRKLSIEFCHVAASELAVIEGWAVRSYDQCKRHLATLPPQLKIKMRDGEDAFVLKCEPSIERDYTTLTSNQVWFGDDHRFDVMVLTGHDENGKPKYERPFLCGWQDARSRMIVGWKIIATDPNAESVLATFEMAALEHGVPEWVYIDNGKHYDGLAVGGLTKKRRRKLASVRRTAGSSVPPAETAGDPFCGAFPGLNVKVKHAKPYHGQSKTIERAFGTICSRFSKNWETYCGNTPFTRPEDLAKQLDLGKAPTLAEFTAAFSEWLEHDYHGRRHLGQGMEGDMPINVYAANLVRKRPVQPEILRFYCSPVYCPERKRRDHSIERGLLIGKQGVTWNGLHFGAFTPAVQKLYGQRVMLRIKRDDVSRVLVCGLDGSLICEAPRNTQLGIVDENAQDVRSALAEKKKLRKTEAAYREQRTRMSHDTGQLVADAGRKRVAAAKQLAAGSERPLPPSLMPVRTSVDGQLPEIQRALQTNKKAVGAENVDLDTLRPRMPALKLADEREANEQEEELDVFAALSAAMRNQRGDQ